MASESNQLNSVADVMSFIEDGYLLLLQENYLDDTEGRRVRDQIDALSKILIESGQLEVVIQLVKSRDWREIIVGIYCVIAITGRGPGTWIAPRPSEHFKFGFRNLVNFGNLFNRPKLLSQTMWDTFNSAIPGELRKLILVDEGRSLNHLFARADILALTARSDKSSIQSLFTAKFQEESVEEYAAAAAALQMLNRWDDGQRVEEDFNDIFARLRADPYFDSDFFEMSKQRFSLAAKFWRQEYSGLFPHTEVLETKPSDRC